MNFSSGFKKYFFNTSWILAERIFRIFVALCVGIYVIRYLGPEQYGLLNYSLSFVGLFLVLQTLGLDGIVIRELVKNPNRRDELLGTAFGLRICGGLVLLGSIAAVLSFINIDKQSSTLITIIALSTIFQTFSVIDINYQAEVKAKIVVHVQLLQLILSSILKVTLIEVKASLIWFAWVYFFDSAVWAIGLIIIYSRYTGEISKWRIKLNTARILLKDSLFLMLSGMVISFYIRIDQIMIKEMLGASDVGFYAAAVKISEAWYFIPTAISASVFPAIINAKKESFAIFSQRMINLYELMIWLALSIALPITFIAPWLIKILLGPEYQPSAYVLSIHIWTGIFVFIGVTNAKWLIIENLQKFHFINRVLGALINVFLNYLLIPRYGINGAAAATIVSQAYAAYFGLFFFKKTRKSFWELTKAILLVNRLKIIQLKLLSLKNKMSCL